MNVISNYNSNPLPLINLIDGDYLLFDQSDQFTLPEKLIKSTKYKKTLHSGHNLSDYFEYLIENYSQLPERVVFLKGNMIGRHISKKDFLNRIQLPGCASLYSDENTFNPKKQLFRFIAQQIAPGVYLEKNNNWYCKSRNKGKYYPTLNDLFKNLFSYPAPRYIPFIPGGCLITTRDKILQWSKDTYKHLYEITTYEFFPVEAYHAERIMMYLFFFNRV